MLKSFLLLLLLGISGTLSAQRWQVGGGIGANLFKGDLMDWSLRPSVDQLLQASPSLNLQVRYQENQAFAYRGVLSVGQIKGDGSLAPTPSSGFDPNSFSGPIIELGGIVDYNFRDYQSNKKIQNWSPYLYAGLATIFAEPKFTSNNQIKSIFALGIPFGVGIKYELNSRWGIQADFGTTRALSDKLDNFWMPAPEFSGDGFLNLAQTDQNLHVNLSITYSIISIFCPKE